MAGRIIGAKVIEAVERDGHLIGYRVQELHSTKGWHNPFLIGRGRFPYGAIVGEFHARPNTKKRWFAESGRLMRNRPVMSPVGAELERARRRHTHPRSKRNV